MLKPDYYVEPTETDRFVFEQMIPQDHYLRRVVAAIDFEFVRGEVADCYSAEMGRPAQDPVRLLKLLFLRFHYDLSDDDVIAHAQVNVAFRFFLGLSVTSRLPDPSLLSQFRTRLGAERFKRIFERVVGQARALGMVKDRLRLKDATHVIADVAVPSTTALVAQMRGRVLAALRPLAPEQVEQQEAEAEQIRVATSDLKDAQRLLARVEHLRRIVVAGEAVLAGEQAKGGPESGTEAAAVAALKRALEQARKVLSDREEKAKDKLVSLVDPDVRAGKHGQWYDGYLLDVLVDADSELITAVDVLSANADEAANATALIEAEEQAHGNDVEALSIDAIGYRGEVLEALSDSPEGPGLTVYVPTYKRGGAKAGLFEAEQFEVDEQTGTMRCPAGQQTQSRTYVKKRHGSTYYFTKSQCRGCPLREQCLGPGEKPERRSVHKNDYEAQYARAKRVTQSQEYVAVRRQHPRVERKLADLIRNHAGRRVRYRGRARVRAQYFLTAMVVNIKRIVNHLLPSLQPQAA